MQWGELYEVFKKNKFSYGVWLLANVGGLLIVYLAVGTIFFIVNTKSNYYPGPHEYLLLGAMSVAVSGVSYNTLRKESYTNLNPYFQNAWGIILTVVYGLLIAFGVKATPYEDATTWSISILAAILCLFWASITWLHEQGIRSDMSSPTDGKSSPPQVLTDTAKELPKISTPKKRNTNKTGSPRKKG